MNRQLPASLGYDHQIMCLIDSAFVGPVETEEFPEDTGKYVNLSSVFIYTFQLKKGRTMQL